MLLQHTAECEILDGTLHLLEGVKGKRHAWFSWKDSVRQVGGQVELRHGPGVTCHGRGGVVRDRMGRVTHRVDPRDCSLYVVLPLHPPVIKDRKIDSENMYESGSSENSRRGKQNQAKAKDDKTFKNVVGTLYKPRKRVTKRPTTTTKMKPMTANTNKVPITDVRLLNGIGVGTTTKAKHTTPNRRIRNKKVKLNKSNKSLKRQKARPRAKPRTKTQTRKRPKPNKKPKSKTKGRKSKPKIKAKTNKKRKRKQKAKARPLKNKAKKKQRQKPRKKVRKPSPKPTTTKRKTKPKPTKKGPCRRSKLSARLRRKLKILRSKGYDDPWWSKLCV